MKLGKKSNFLIIYIGFFLLPIILLLSEKNIPQVTIVHLKLFFGAQLIILIIFSILSYLIFKILLPLLKINISLSDFLLINSFFIYLLFFYKQINSTFSPGSHKMMMDNLISILFYFIIYIIFFYFYIKEMCRTQNLLKNRSPGRSPEGKGGFPGAPPRRVVFDYTPLRE